MSNIIYKNCSRNDHIGDKNLPTTDFYADQRFSDGKSSHCKCCQKRIRAKSNKKQSQEVKDRAKKTIKDWYDRKYAEDPTPFLQRSKKYRNTNKEHCLEKGKQWKRNNPEKQAEYACYRFKYLKYAKPKWANDEKIKEIYEERNKLTESTGTEYQVDHIIPITHKLVCGLHNEFNLQLLTKEENLSKSNTFLVE